MLCEKTGATVGCDLKSYFKNYHFFYAKNDHTILADGLKGIYKVFCQQHADPQNGKYLKFSVVGLKKVNI